MNHDPIDLAWRSHKPWVSVEIARRLNSFRARCPSLGHATKTLKNLRMRDFGKMDVAAITCRSKCRLSIHGSARVSASAFDNEHRTCSGGNARYRPSSIIH